jgi:hypothetical protein
MHVCVTGEVATVHNVAFGSTSLRLTITAVNATSSIVLGTFLNT